MFFRVLRFCYAFCVILLVGGVSEVMNHHERLLFTVDLSRIFKEQSKSISLCYWNSRVVNGNQGAGSRVGKWLDR